MPRRPAPPACRWPALFLALAMNALPAAAQGVPAIPEVLRDMPLAGQMCKNEKLGTGAGGAIRPERGVDMGCALPASAVAGFLQRPGATVIDTREEPQYAQFHLASAMRLDPASVRLKPYLRDKPLLLVGDGKAERELYAACGSLKAQGFTSVQVLQGGMSAYVAKDLPVVARSVPPSLKLAQLEASEFWAESQFAQNLLVVLDSPKISEMVPMATSSANASPQALAAALDRRRKESKTPLASVIVAIDAPMSDTTFRDYVRAVSPMPLLVYSQGAEPLARFIKSQQAIWAAHARGPKQPRCG